MKKLFLLGMLLSSGVSQACITDTINLGVLNGPSHIDLIGSFAQLRNEVVGSGAYVKTGNSTESIESFTSGYGSIQYDYDFSFSDKYKTNNSPLFSMKLNPFGSGHDSFVLIDKTSGQEWNSVLKNGEYDLIANIPIKDLHDKFTIQIGINGILGKSGGFEATGDVPIPGAIYLFGTALLGLFLFSRKKVNA